MTIQTALLRPDTGEAAPTGPRPTPAVAEPSWLDRATGWADAIPTGAWAALAAVILGFVAYRAIRNRRVRTSAKSDKLMTFFGAAVATGVVGTGMWAFFGDTLGITNPWLRAALFAFFEIAMLASALRSRRFRLDRAAAQVAEADRRARVLAVDPDAKFDDNSSREMDVDGVAVWILALLSGTLAATHEHTAGAVGLRLVAPLIAAWLWERGLAGELRQFRRPGVGRKVHWRITPERVAVWLRIAEGSGRAVNEVERARLRTAFTIAAFRLHTRLADGARPWRVSVARWRLRRAGIAIMRKFGVTELTAARADVATLYGIEEATSPDAVAGLTPWQTGRVIDGTVTDAQVTARPKMAVTAAKVSPVTPPPAEPDTATPAVRHVPAPRREVTPTPAAEADATTSPTGDDTRVRPLSRDLIDAEFRTWTADQVAEYATKRAQQVVAETSNKTAGMREYFLTCLALGVEPTGSGMARAVDAAGSLGRTQAKKWHGELTVDDAEQVLRDAAKRIAAELAAGGDGRD